MNVRKSIVLSIAAGLCCTTTMFGQAAVPPSPSPMRLTLKDAEQLALKNNPRISVAKLLSLAQHQVTREVRSAELPAATANLTAVEPHTGSRITAGGLNNPIIYERAAGGVTVSQTITDFGRTRNLIAAAHFGEQERTADEQATIADITLAADEAFYNALGAQALLNVAQQTVNARQVTADQVQALFNSKLKSELDLSFANVNLAQAKLLLLDAQNRQQAAFADLNAIVGFDRQQTYLLMDETGGPLPSPPASSAGLLDQAFRSRPDLQAVQFRYESQERFRRAEHDLSRPTISALAAVGDTPVRVPQLSPWYGAAGVNISIPVFNGFLFSARARAADYQAQAAQQQVRDLRDRISRDVQVTYLQAQTAFQRVGVAEQLLNQANLALDLAQTRYRLGLSSIVELSQAQLQQTEAAIGSTNARYQYLATLSTLRYETGQ